MKTAVDNLGYYNRTADIYKPMVDAVEKEDNLEVNTSGEETVLSEIGEKENKHEPEDVIEEKKEDATTLKQFEINRFLENSRKKEIFYE